MKSIILHDFEVRNALKNDAIQIRRPIPQADGVTKDGVVYKFKTIDVVRNWGIETIGHPDGKPTHRYCDIIKCHFGQARDRLWVRETWWHGIFVDADDNIIKTGVTLYKADEPNLPNYGEYDYIWSPSIHMPREASRILLEIDEVRAEQVQDITEDDARAQGVEPEFEMSVEEFYNKKILPNSTYKLGFKHFWDSIYSKKGFGWEKNLPVWVGVMKVAERKRWDEMA